MKFFPGFFFHMIECPYWGLREINASSAMEALFPQHEFFFSLPLKRPFYQVLSYPFGSFHYYEAFTPGGMDSLRYFPPFFSPFQSPASSSSRFAHPFFSFTYKDRDGQSAIYEEYFIKDPTFFFSLLNEFE